MKKTPFVGRKKEIESLRLLFKKKSSSLVVVQGRRRIGKSRLISEFAKNHRFYSFLGLPPAPEKTAQDERDEFANQLAEAFGMHGIKADDWTTLFTLLAKQVQKNKVIILLDEISWMGSKDPLFLGKLKNAWDLYFKQNPNLMLILCGSISPWIEKNILSSTGFFGRISLNLHVDELNISECSDLLEEIGCKFASHDKFTILSVTGGIPRYLEEIQPTLTAEENIRRLCFNKDGVLFREFDDIFSDLFSKRSEYYKKIVEILSSGAKELNDICKDLKKIKSGNISECLENLIESGFIARDFTWHIIDGKESRLSKYRLCDNYLRFYLKYIQKNRAKIERGHFAERSLATLPAFESIMGYQFENLVLNNRKLILDKLRITGELIISDNPYFQRKTSKVPGCQIDYLIQTKFNNLFMCEIKFSKNYIGPQVINEMQSKMKSLITPKGFSKFCVLIHINGVHNSVQESEFFTEILDFSEFLN